MKTYYSIIYATLKTIVDEKIAVGLILANENHVLYKFSDTKLQLIKSLLKNDNYNFIKTILQTIDNKINTLITNDLFNNQKVDSFFSESNLSYLADYNNNLILIDKPKIIELEVTDENFKILFEKFVFQFVEKKKVHSKIEKTVSKKLYPRIEKRVNLDRIITPAEIDSLYYAVDVNFIGKNGITVTGNIFDFNKPEYHLKAELSQYQLLIMALENIKKNGKYFIVADEPEKDKNNQLSIWNEVLKHKSFEIVIPNEIEKISEYVETNGVQPYFTK